MFGGSDTSSRAQRKCSPGRTCRGRGRGWRGRRPQSPGPGSTHWPCCSSPATKTHHSVHTSATQPGHRTPALRSTVSGSPVAPPDQPPATEGQASLVLKVSQSPNGFGFESQGPLWTTCQNSKSMSHKVVISSMFSQVTPFSDSKRMVTEQNDFLR